MFIRIFTSCIIFIIFIFLLNASFLAPAPKGERSFLAHRGVHQTYDRTNLGIKDCTAARIFSPTHSYLENTISSIEAAFSYGADIVEIDIYTTSDDQIAVFHDDTIDCRTNGSGRTEEQSMAYLQSLDIGHGYTPDKGATYPFRGKAIGLLPSLGDVLQKFPDRKFLINIKSNNKHQADVLAAFLNANPDIQLENLSVYGGGLRALNRLQDLKPTLNIWSKQSLKACLKFYMLIGWTGRVPEKCQNTTLLIPQNYAKYLWGWPNKFQYRMNKSGTKICLTGAVNDKNKSLSGIRAEYSQIPDSYKGCIWTDNIETINPATL